MRIINFTITQDGQVIDNVAVREQAVDAAKARAAETGRPVSIIAHLSNGRGREVIFNPDGTNEKIWEIDKGRRLEPVVGQVYVNRGGGRFRCVSSALGGPVFYNVAGGRSNASGVFQNIKSGWTFTAKGIIQYVDGTIEWDHSVDGRFETMRE